MDSAMKAFEMQAQVRHNAQTIQSTMRELYDWQKEIKEKEKKIKEQQPEEVAQPQAENKKNKQPALQTTASTRKPQAKSVTVATANQNGDTKTAGGRVPQDQAVKEAEPVEDADHKAANELKDKGNGAVKLAQYTTGIDYYTAAIMRYSQDAVYFANRALCYLRLEDYGNCIADCEEAIALDKTFTKAYYRRMQANEGLGNNLEALKDCMTVLTLEPNSTEAKKSMDRINNRIRQNFETGKGPKFSPTSDRHVPAAMGFKPPHARSKKPLVRVPVKEIVGPKDSKNYANTQLQISDELIDKLFNSDCGTYVEKKPNKQPASDAKKAKLSDTAAAKLATVPETVKSAEVELKANAIEITNTKAKPLIEESKSMAEAKEDAKQLNASNCESTKKTAYIVPTKKTPPPVQSLASENLAVDCAKAAATPIAVVSQEKITEQLDKVAEKNAKPAIELKTTKRETPPAPNTTAEFYAIWKSLEAREKYQYLKSIESAKLPKILGAGLDSDMLSDILQILQNFYLPQQELTELANTLLALSRVESINILYLFLNDTDRKVMANLLNSLKQNKEQGDVVALVEKKFTQLF